MLKSILLISSLLAVCSSYAGVHGGGVMAVSQANIDSRSESLGNGSGTMSSPKIVFNMGETLESIKFAYGELVNNNWQTQKIVLPKSEIQSELLNALNNSKHSNGWVEFK